MKILRYFFVLLFMFFVNHIKSEEINYFRVFEYKGMELNNVRLGEILSTRGSVEGIKHLLGKGLVEKEKTPDEILLEDAEKGIVVKVKKVIDRKRKVMKIVEIRLFGDNCSVKFRDDEIKKGDAISKLDKRIKIASLDGVKTIILENVEGRGENTRLLFDENDKLKEIRYLLKKKG